MPCSGFMAILAENTLPLHLSLVVSFGGVKHGVPPPIKLFFEVRFVDPRFCPLTLSPSNLSFSFRLKLSF
jgi:hypothetical protein